MLSQYEILIVKLIIVEKSVQSYILSRYSYNTFLIKILLIMSKGWLKLVFTSTTSQLKNSKQQKEGNHLERGFKIKTFFYPNVLKSVYIYIMIWKHVRALLSKKICFEFRFLLKIDSKLPQSNTNSQIELWPRPLTSNSAIPSFMHHQPPFFK